MRVPEDHLVAHFVHTIGNVEGPFLLADTGIEDHMVQQVADFLGGALSVAFQDGIGQFVPLFFRHRADAVHRLGRIPGALLPQGVHNIQQTAESGQFFLARVHSIQI